MQLQAATDAAQAARVAANGKAQEAASSQRRLAQERQQVQVLKLLQRLNSRCQADSCTVSQAGSCLHIEMLGASIPRHAQQRTQQAGWLSGQDAPACSHAWAPAAVAGLQQPSDLRVLMRPRVVRK